MKVQITRKHGFTLIELLVVISIIALLVSILMPALSGARGQARAVVCSSNQRQLVLGWIYYADDNNGRLPGGHNGEAYSIEPGRVDWVAAPQDEAGNHIPVETATVEDKIRGIERGSIFQYTQHAYLYNCPDDRRDIQKTALRSYGIPGSMNGDCYWKTLGDEGWCVHEYGGPTNTKYANIRRPSEKYVFVEEGTDAAYSSWGSWNQFGSGDQWLDPPALRHGNVTNLGFADGHAETHSWDMQSTIDMAYLDYPGGWVAYDGLDDLEYVRKGLRTH